MLDHAPIRRILEDRLRAEIAASRHGHADLLPPTPWVDALPIGPAGLGADSLELLTLAGAVNEMFHLHETGIEDTLLVRRTFGAWVDLVQQAWGSRPDRVTFRSSGSTGQPRRHTHVVRDLLTEVDEHAGRLRPKRILSAVPAHHIYGFIFTVLLPRHAACDVVDIRNHLPAREDCRPGDVIVSYPEHWRYLLQTYDPMPAAFGVTSAAPMPTALAHNISAAGLSRLVEVYGSSETAGIGWRDDPDSPFTLLRHWSFQPPHPGSGALRLIGPAGRNAATPDAAAAVGERYFTLGPRLDTAIQVGGINVYPARIAAVLEQHPGVAHARVRAAAPESGGRLQALVVPTDPAADPDALRNAIQHWIARHLSGPEQPRSVLVTPRLPHGVLGKVCNWPEPA